jgi:RND family efflux transporter MFP subunit
MSRRRLKGIAGCILLISALILVSCSPKTPTSTTTTQTYTVKRGTISSQLTPTGNLQMPHQTKLTFGVAGTISQILVIMGQNVTKGDLLAKLDDASILTLQQALVQAQIDEKNAEVALENAETLTYNNNGTFNIPDPLNISIKQLALDKTKISLTNAQQNIDMATLEAPYDGMIAEVNSIVGDKIAANTQIMRIIDPTKLQVTALVNETDIFNISLGLTATVQVTALSSTTMPATVTAISPEIGRAHV